MLKLKSDLYQKLESSKAIKPSGRLFVMGIKISWEFLRKQHKTVICRLAAM